MTFQSQEEYYKQKRSRQAGEDDQTRNEVFSRRGSIEENLWELEHFWTSGNEVWTVTIQRVPDYMGGREEFKRFYFPTLISIGPFHYDKPYVEQGQQYKKLWTAMYLRNTNQAYDDLFERVYAIDPFVNSFWDFYNLADIPPNIKPPYNDNDIWGSPLETQFMLMEDGCSILQVLERSLDSENPEKELMLSTDKLVRVHQDLLLLENQFPFNFLKHICNDTARLKRCMRNFLVIHGVDKNEELSTIVQVQEEEQEEASCEINEELSTIVQVQEEESEEEPRHLLDYLRRALLRRDHSQIHKEIKLKKLKRRSLHFRKYRIGTIRELKAAGIEPEDVKELRHAGILRNELATDKEVADLFNKMDIVLVPETARFSQIRDQIEAHFVSKRSKIKVMGWMVEAYNNYFRSPWAILALLAAILGLTLTFIQTWYAIHPKGS